MKWIRWTVAAHGGRRSLYGKFRDLLIRPPLARMAENQPDQYSYSDDPRHDGTHADHQQNDQFLRTDADHRTLAFNRPRHFQPSATRGLHCARPAAPAKANRKIHSNCKPAVL